MTIVTTHDDEISKASSAYLMSLVAVVIGLPMPIINLIATGTFYFMSRRSKSHFVRWNCLQAFVSQIPLFIMNNILFWWTVRLVLGYTLLSDAYISYFVVVNLYNVIDLVATIRSACATYKGRTFRWFLYSSVTDLICKQ